MLFSDLISKPRRALFGQMTLYYLVLFGAYKLIHHWFPSIANYIYGWERRQTQVSFSDFDQIQTMGVADFSDLQADTAVALAVSLAGALLLMVPVTWVYIGTRRRKGLDQSMIETLLILPISVAGVVTIVQHSLALAFSLAGIFAGVQFRSRLKMYADAHFIFIAIGIGFAAGIGAPHIAAVTSIFFNYATFLIWRVSYGSESSERHLRRTTKKSGPGIKHHDNSEIVEEAHAADEKPEIERDED